MRDIHEVSLMILAVCMQIKPIALYDQPKKKMQQYMCSLWEAFILKDVFHIHYFILYDSNIFVGY